MRVAAVGENRTRLWGLTAEERLDRIARAQKLERDDGAEAAVLVNLAFVWDPSWLRFIVAHPGHVLTKDGVPALAHVTDPTMRERVARAMAAGVTVAPMDGFQLIAHEEAEGLSNNELRKRERPFLDRLIPDNVRTLERASYFGAYKGVTDILTKYLWPEWALVLTRISARLGVTPNMVTALGAILCVVATILFYHGWYWTGMAAGLAFMVLDTVDGKLARCTITSSWWGNVFDHGIDLVHPPFWWYAWGVGLAAYGRPLEPGLFWGMMAVLIGGYVVQRLIEGAFMRVFGMHVHVWRRFDSRFRLITARRNPNMVILFVALLFQRPDIGFIGIALWTLLSLVVHAVQLMQALIARGRGETIRSWLA